MGKLTWPLVAAALVAAYLIGWPLVLPKVNEFRVKQAATDVCREIGRRVQGGLPVTAAQTSAHEQFMGKLAAQKLTIESTVASPLRIDERSCVLSATVVTKVGGEAKRHDVRLSKLW